MIVSDRVGAHDNDDDGGGGSSGSSYKEQWNGLEVVL